jgi:Ca2+-binding RTX toxin-like protein
MSQTKSKKTRTRTTSKQRRGRHLRPQLELLESRLALATVFGIVGPSTLVRFDSATPGTVDQSVSITGLVGGDTIQGIDFRPATGQLFALGSGNRLYTINTTTGAASAPIPLVADPTDATNPFTTLVGTSFGVDFNPVPDRLRVVSNSEQNLRINPTNGLVITDDALNPGNPEVVGSAYTNGFAGATATTLFGIDATSDSLVIQNPPNNGTLVAVGTGLGAGDITDVVGFDILAQAGNTNVGFAALTTNGTSSGLYTVDLTTGTATLVGNFGGPVPLLRGLAVVPEVTPNATLLAIDQAAILYRFNSATPGTVSTTPVTGLGAGDIPEGLDFRPATGELYLLTRNVSGADRIYRVNPATGAATQIGSDGAFTLNNAGFFGFDFNPVVDRIRVTNSASPNQNLRLNPNDGTLAATDGLLAYAAGDPNAAATPEVEASAYTNNFAGATSTTLYGIDTNLDILVIQNPPNSGTLNTVGSLGINTFNNAQFDIQPLAGGGNRAFAALAPDNLELFTINLDTGAATSLGSIGASDLRGLTVVPNGTFQFSAPTYSVSEDLFFRTITVNRIGGSEGIATVRVDTNDGTATAPFDYAESGQVLVFGPGETSRTFDIPIVDDSEDEADETVNLVLSNPTGGAVLGAQSTAILTIVDNDDVPFPVCEILSENFAGELGTAVLQDDADSPGDTVLLVTGTSRSDVIIIEPRPVDRSQIRVKINGQLAGIFTSSDVQRIVAFGLTGNDKIIVNATLLQLATLFGNEGDDYLFGAKGSDGLDGGNGADRLFGGLNDDTLCGGNGNDFVYGQAGNDLVGGDAGNDKVFGEGGNDLLLGNDGNDRLFGGIGNDQLFGQAGNDQIFGDRGNDIAVGGDGNDKLFGDGGRDVLIGGDGADLLFGEGLDDILVAGSTAHDENEEALQAILAEWTSSNSYDTRVNNLRNGGGANGAFVLDDTTVIDDGVKDSLFGNGGLDWFLFGDGDKLRDMSRSELVN